MRPSLPSHRLRRRARALLRHPALAAVAALVWLLGVELGPGLHIAGHEQLGHHHHGASEVLACGAHEHHAAAERHEHHAAAEHHDHHASAEHHAAAEHHDHHAAVEHYDHHAAVEHHDHHASAEHHAAVEHHEHHVAAEHHGRHASAEHHEPHAEATGHHDHHAVDPPPHEQARIDPPRLADAVAASATVDGPSSPPIAVARAPLGAPHGAHSLAHRDLVPLTPPLALPPILSAPWQPVVVSTTMRIAPRDRAPTTLRARGPPRSVRTPEPPAIA